MEKSVPNDLAASILAKCGRCCCICRRFRPTLLQVHHIVTASEGGTDEEDNLIALCITCHSDVHTKRPFTRRFSFDEQKQHRNQVISLVAQGKLLPREDEQRATSRDDLREWTQSIVEAASRIISSTAPVTERRPPGLDSAATEVLLGAAESQQGDVIVFETSSGLVLHTGDRQLLDGVIGREAARYRASVERLQGLGLIERIDRSYYRLTWEGYYQADQILAMLRRHVQEGVGSKARN